MDKLYWIIFGLLAVASPAMADLDTTYLPDRPTGTLGTALHKAENGPKAVFLILFDDEKTPRESLAYFFDSDAVKQSFEEDFVICVRDRDRSGVEEFDDENHDWNRPKFVVLTPDGEPIFSGRMLMNDEVGRRKTKKAVKRWLAVKPNFIEKQAKDWP